MGAPVGNRNGSKGDSWEQAIRRALKARSLVAQREILDDAADALINKAIDGDIAALKELGDRLDGKAKQSVIVGGDTENPLIVQNSLIDAAAARLATNTGAVVEHAIRSAIEHVEESGEAMGSDSDGEVSEPD